MRIYFKNQEPVFKKLLNDLMRKPVTKFDKARLKEKVTMTDIDREDFENIDLDFFFNYMIFPSDIMSFMTQWKMEKRGMKIGDTILQQVFIPPVRIFSYKILFGVRINNIIDEVDRKGFSYETIEGHVEKGESTFLIERTENRLIFKIKTFSEPGNLLAKLAGSFFALPYQAYCTRRALKNVKKQIESPSVNA